MSRDVYVTGDRGFLKGRLNHSLVCLARVDTAVGKQLMSLDAPAVLPKIAPEGKPSRRRVKNFASGERRLPERRRCEESRTHFARKR